jgi:hypothetical protein
VLGNEIGEINPPGGHSGGCRATVGWVFGRPVLPKLDWLRFSSTQCNIDRTAVFCLKGEIRLSNTIQNFDSPYSDYEQQSLNHLAPSNSDKEKGRAKPEPFQEPIHQNDSSDPLPNLKSSDLAGLEFRQGDTFVEGSSSGNTVREQYLGKTSPSDAGASAESITRQILAGRDSKKNPAEVAKELNLPEFMVQATLDANPRTGSSGEPAVAAYAQASSAAAAQGAGNNGPASPANRANNIRLPRLKPGVMAPWNSPRNANPRTGSSREPAVAAYAQASNAAAAQVAGNNGPASPANRANNIRLPRLKPGVMAPWNPRGT